MKRLIAVLLACCFCLATPLARAQGLAQGLAQGNLVGIHLVTVTLKPGVTMEQWRDFYVRRVLPEYAHNWDGLHGYLLKSISGDRLAVVWLFDSVAQRDRYFTNGRANDLERAAHERVAPIETELRTSYGDYTVQYLDTDDWVVE